MHLDLSFVLKSSLLGPLWARKDTEKSDKMITEVEIYLWDSLLWKWKKENNVRLGDTK